MQIQKFARACRFTLLFAAFSATVVSAQVESNALPIATPRVVDRIDEATRIQLTGNIHPLARAEFDWGLADLSLPMGSMQLVLKRSPQQEAELVQLIADQQDPGSPKYHQWLHASDFGARFGVSDADLQTVTAWLQGHGFHVDDVSKSHMFVTFSGTAANVQEAFRTEMHRYNVRGVQHLSNNTDISIPAALSPVVLGVHSLSDFFAQPAHVSKGNVHRDKQTGKWSADAASQPKPAFGISLGAGNGSLEEVTPYDFAAIYNVLPLWSAGIDGTGVGIAIAGRSDISLSDVATFRSAFGLPVKAPTIIVNGADPGVPSTGDKEENTLDVEWSGAVAKNANVTLVTSASTATADGAALSALYIIDHETAPIMSYSYQNCELGAGQAGNAYYNNLWQQAAAAGITVFVATGDFGAAQCDGGGTSPSPATHGMQVSGLSSTPYNTAVGGTDLNWQNAGGTYWSATNAANGSSALGYMPEVPWNQTCASNAVDQFYGFTAAGFDAEQSCQYDVTNNFDIDLVNVVGGSGGKSSCISPTGTTPATCAAHGGYPKPSWQTGTGVPADSARDVPDLSLFASSNVLYSAYLICDTAVGKCDYTASSDDAEMQAVGGTSVASPAMAGIMAMVLQKTGVTQGLANPILYKLAAQDNRAACNSGSVAAGNACNFYDITTDSIKVPCSPTTPDCTVLHSGDTVGLTTGQSASQGFDLATGLGSVNANNLVNNWASAGGSAAVLTPTSFAFPSTVANTTSSSTAVFTLKNTGSVALSLTNLGISGTNTNDLSATTTCPFGSTLAVNATCTISFTYSPTAAGTLSATIEVDDSAGAQTATITGTATAASVGTISLSPTSLAFGSVAVGSQSAAKTVTITNAGTAPVVLDFNNTTFVGAGAGSYPLVSGSCGTQSTYSLAAGSSCNLGFVFKPASAGSLPATFELADNAPASPQTVAFTGTGTAAASTLTFTPSSLTFASTAIGTTTAAQLITIKNTGTTAVSFTAATTIGGANASSFAKTASTCPNPLPAGSSCTNSITFDPTTSGTLTAQVTYTDSATGSPQTVALTGAGASAGPTLTFTPSSLTFASTPIGTTTAAQMITIKNTGTTAVTFTAATTIGGTNASSFAKTASTCPNPLPAGSSCTNSITFDPTTSGTLTAHVTYTDGATGSPQTVALTGTGASSGSTLTFTPSSLTFASTAIGITTAAQLITIKNTGTTAVSFTAATTIGGANASSFAKTASTCPNPLPAGSSCTNSITFDPTTSGTLTAQVTYTDSATGSPQTVALTGTGASVGPTLTFTPSSLTFAPTAIGTTTAAQTITIKNTGTTAVTFTAATTIGGTNASSFAKTASTCPNPLPAGSSCTNSITFDPTAAGTLTAQVTYTDTATGSPQTVALSGTGASPGLTFTPSSLTFASTAVGTTTAAQLITIKNTSTAAVTFTAATTIGGTNASSFIKSASTCPNPLPAGASCTNSIEFDPTATGTLTAHVTYTDTAAGSPQTVALTGTGH